MDSLVRGRIVQTRLSDHEYAGLERLARADETSVAEFLRALVLREVSLWFLDAWPTKAGNWRDVHRLLSSPPGASLRLRVVKQASPKEIIAQVFSPSPRHGWVGPCYLEAVRLYSWLADYSEGWLVTAGSGAWRIDNIIEPVPMPGQR